MPTATKMKINGASAPPPLAVSAVIVCCLLLSLPVDADNGRLEWQILSGKNFSSQIHLHPHVLVFFTVPWCGESRSLMNDLSRQLSDKEANLASIKLMVVFRNQDQVLAESFGAAHEITVFFYKYGIRYKYTGRLSARDILFSANYLMSLLPDGLPLMTLDTSDDLEKFLASTDKAVLLLDSCGWTPKLLAQYNDSEASRGISGGDSTGGFSIETKQTILSGGQKNVEALRSEKLKCGIDHGFGGIPWVQGFSLYNETWTSLETDVKLTAESSCTLGDHQKFASFFSKFIVAARDTFLPPHRQRYGLVSNSSLLSSLGVESFDAWSLIVYYAGCPNCLKVLKNESNLQVALEMHNLPVMELISDRVDSGPAFPVHEPSVVLFVDRSADSVEAKTRSTDALSAFKEAALQYKNSLQKNVQSADLLEKPLVQTYKESTTISRDPRIVLSSLSQKVNDKMSVMIINEGAHATLDNADSTFQGHSLREILTQLLGQKKQAKLSLLAKEVGFQLISDDIDINITDESSHTESHSDSTSTNPSLEHLRESGDDTNNDADSQSSSLEDHKKQYDLPVAKLSNSLKEEATQDLTDVPSSYGNSKHLSEGEPSMSADDTNNDANSQSSSLEDHKKQYDLPVAKLSNSLKEEATQDFTDVPSSYGNSKQLSEGEPSMSADAYSQKQNFLHSDQVVKQLHQAEGFSGSFFFSDGNYQLLKSLTSESKVPRMVIIDPVSQTHFVSPQRKDFSYLSISDFIDRVFNGSFPPHQRSASLQDPLEAPRPPFVNLDFHEKDSIPSLSTNEFTELVLGSSSLDAQNSSNAQNKDVLVLLSNSWCGFCQRMDLVVREVYRSLKGYMNLGIGGPKKKVVISNDSLKAVMLELPMIYRIDCTWNDCSWILKSLHQREFYPSLMLFPTKLKTALSYDGDLAVNSIVSFIAKHASSSFQLVQQKSDEKEYQNLVKDVPPTVSDQHSSDAHEYPPLDHIQQDQVRYTQKVISVDAKTPQYSIVAGSFLIATDKLAGVNPFSSARVLIISADQHTGFRGLIVNKPINQESHTEIGLPEVLKEATVSFGGPVVHPQLHFTALTKKQFEGQYSEVLPGVYVLDEIATSGEMEKLKAGKGSAAHLWFFLGYSGWGWHQLFDEISQGAWILEDGNDARLDWP